MDISDEDNIEIYSRAGLLSGEKYNITNSFEKIKNPKKNMRNFDSYIPDKEYLKKIKGKVKINYGEKISGINFNIDELKKEIKKNSLYLKQEEEENKNKKNEFKYNEKHYNNIYSDKNDIEISNKRQLFKGKRYKYYNEHMRRMKRYKAEGLLKAILKPKETSYVPKLEYIYKKVLTGPKWEKLSSRDLFNLDKKSLNNKENEKEKEKINISIKNKKSEKNKSRNKTLIPKKMKLTKSLKKNNTELSNKLSSKLNENTNYSSNKYLKSSFLNSKSNTKLKLSFEFKKNSLINSNKISYDNNVKKLLKINQNNNNIRIKRENLPGPDFNRYLDLEKVERKKKRLQKIPLGKIELRPNYSSIEGNIKSFVNYHQKKIELIKKPRIFKGLNSYEFLYDAGKTFDNIYGKKMKAVPKFIKMMERPSDINLPTYMKGLYSRLGLELPGEKSLKMNNYENGKMYNRSNSFLGFNKNYHTLRSIYYEDDIEKNVDKIDRDLDVMKKKFRSIKYIKYD